MSETIQNQINYIRSIKEKHGDKILIPAHHYINAEIVGLADIVGDSYKLAVDVAASNAEYIVFAGVRFMAESAAVLAKDNQKIFHPNISAGCPMADMIDSIKAEKVISEVNRITGLMPKPVVYMNSYADSKAVTGKNGGSVSTSSNAEKIVNYYLDQNIPIFFFPDYHLGRNIADKMGISESEIITVKQDLSFDKTPTKDVKIYLWDGYCHVHQNFAVEEIKSIREEHPGIKVLVHPECNRELVAAADKYGSTQEIYDEVSNAVDGTKWAIGTEINFVERLKNENPNKTIIPIRISACPDMARISIASVVEILQKIDAHISTGSALPEIVEVDKNLKEDASLSLKKMIEIVES